MAGSNLNSTTGNFNQLVECPRCRHRFQLSETFRAQFEEEKRNAIDTAVQESEAGIRAELEQANQKKLEENAKQVKKLEAQLKTDREVHEKREAEIRAELEQANQEKLEESTEQVKKLEAQLKADREVHEKREAEIRAELEQANQEKLEESTEQVKKLEAQLKADRELRVKREAEIRAELEQASQEKLEESTEQVKKLETQLKADRELQEKREAEIRTEAENKVSSDFEIERREWAIEKQRLEKNMADMQRQLGQSPAELQGEALEEYLKHQLQTQFPMDKILDIGRGRAGADLTQEVMDARLGNCGIVVWETKRTKRWNNNWLAKIKKDADRVGAHLRVIVSQTMPTEISNFGQKDGVWVSSIECALPLALALRAQLIETANLQRAMQGRGLKTDALYQYLTSPRFSERIQRMVETWQALQTQVASEERAMQRQWKERRKQLARMQDSTIELFTDFTAILGHEIPQVPGLELEALPSGDEMQIINP